MTKIICMAAAALLCVTPVHAQAPDSIANGPATGWRPLRVAKWSAAGAAVGAALYGFNENRRADRAFESLERTCVTAPERCTDRRPDGGYADADLETQYQSVRGMDRNARAALVAGQIGVAASVALFILDLRNDTRPPNVPFEPRRLDVRPSDDGGVRFTFRLTGTAFRLAF